MKQAILDGIYHDQAYLSFLILSSSLDRFLGDLFFTMTQGKRSPPMLLKDLLVDPELTELLGADIVCTLYVHQISSSDALFAHSHRSTDRFEPSKHHLARIYHSK